MDINYFLLLRQEISLLAIALVLVIFEIFISEHKKSAVVHLAILLFGVHTILGFLSAGRRRPIWRHVPYQ